MISEEVVNEVRFLLPEKDLLKAWYNILADGPVPPAPVLPPVTPEFLADRLEARQAGEKRVILFNLSGHGHFDLAAYEAYVAGRLEDFEQPEEAIRAAMAELPEVPAMA